MDLAVNYDARGTFDLYVSEGDLATDDGLRTAVLVSLFTDRHANPDDELPSGGGNLKGWWADAWPETDGDLIGSRLWLLSRSRQTAGVLRRAISYTTEALEWLIEDGVALDVSCDAAWIDRGTLGLKTKITLSDGTLWTDVFSYPVAAGGTHAI